MESDTSVRQAHFSIFRGAEAPSIEQSGVEKPLPQASGPPPGILEALSELDDHGYSHRVLFSANGMSLIHLWFKSGFVLPRHSHETDCLYFVVAGKLRIGSTDLGAGDGFFVGADVPYTYAAGNDGVEVLEFRAAEQFYLKLLANNHVYWDKFMATMKSKQASWKKEQRPSRGA